MDSSHVLQRNRPAPLVFIVGLSICLGYSALSYGAKRPFTVVDDISLSRFADRPYIVSPDRRLTVVLTEKGILKTNRPESTLRVYSLARVRWSLSHADDGKKVPPLWIIRLSTYRDGPIVSSVRWLPNSSGIAFLAKTHDGNDRLFLADVSSQTLIALTARSEHITGFSVKDRKNFAYSVLRRSMLLHGELEEGSPSFVATGHSAVSLMFPQSLSIWREHDLSDLWAVVAGKRFLVRDKSSGRHFALHRLGEQALTLSPNGRYIATALPIREIPSEWEKLYLPAAPSSPHRIRAGFQEVDEWDGQDLVSQYALIDLVKGNTKPLIDAPIAHGIGWWGNVEALFSDDSAFLVVSNTFLPNNRWDTLAGEPHRPCGSVIINLASMKSACLEKLGTQTDQANEEGYSYVVGNHFSRGTNARVVVSRSSQYIADEVNYIRDENGTWKRNPTPGTTESQGEVVIGIHQSLNDPPVLVSTDIRTRASRTIWDPNPQLKRTDLGEVSVLRWVDKTGRKWVGGLYRPPHFDGTKRYPLVIQTHGFDENRFSPSGIFVTANAAQELASAGIMVLQVRDCPVRNTAIEAQCQLDGYESAVSELVAKGSVDSNRLGIIGFSRTCYYVMEALTKGSLRFRAASITDGINGGYLQYIMAADFDGNFLKEASALIGAPPFSGGLLQWLQRSPEFNMDKVTTPLQVVAIGRRSLLYEWEPYAALRILHKPVDLIVLAEGTHILSNPAERMASQGGAVDWFRFWLNDEIDSSPDKASQYDRWRALRALQDTGAAKQ